MYGSIWFADQDWFDLSKPYPADMCATLLRFEVLITISTEIGSKYNILEKNWSSSLTDFRVQTVSLFSDFSQCAFLWFWQALQNSWFRAVDKFWCDNNIREIGWSNRRVGTPIRQSMIARRCPATMGWLRYHPRIACLCHEVEKSWLEWSCLRSGRHKALASTRLYSSSSPPLLRRSRVRCTSVNLSRCKTT